VTGRQFRTDRGSTFTDLVARCPAGRPPTGVRTPPTGTRALREALSTTAGGTVLRAVGDLAIRRAAGAPVLETPGGAGYGPPPPDPHQAGEETDDLRAF
jgi:5-oxoprolinase (ATP-hydrolysing)